jgi:hypothetical protein
MPDTLHPWTVAKVTLDDGETFLTEIRGPIESVRRYFMQDGGYTDHGSQPEGKEIVRRIVSVDEVTTADLGQHYTRHYKGADSV